MNKADDMLRSALMELKIHGDKATWGLIEKIEEYLSESISSEEVDRSEPVAWGQPGACGCIVETITPDDKLHTKAPKGWTDIYSVPLYLHQPTKTAPKPMTVEEIDEWLAYSPYRSPFFKSAFMSGIRVGEKFHGIGGGE